LRISEENSELKKRHKWSASGSPASNLSLFIRSILLASPIDVNIRPALAGSSAWSIRPAAETDTFEKDGVEIIRACGLLAREEKLD
jgi:hypothetical protein